MFIKTQHQQNQKEENNRKKVYFSYRVYIMYSIHAIDMEVIWDYS